jgi:O-antigen/teichoic acid export membrane protein
MPSVPKVLDHKLPSKAISKKSLTIKASLNALAAAMDYGARLVVGFLINPLLLSGLGNYGYGVWQVLGRLIGYIGPASGRAGHALRWTISHQQSSTDWEEKRRYVGSAVVVWSLFLPLLILLGGILGWFAPFWLEAPEGFILPIRLAAGLLIADLILSSLVELPRSALEGENLGYKRMGLSALLVFVGGGLTAAVLYFDMGLVGVAGVSLAVSLLTGALFLKVAYSQLPWFGIARPSVENVRRFFGLSGWFLAWNLIIKLMRASDVVVLGTVGSVELVTVYTLTKYAPESIVNLVAVVAFGITPGLGGIIGSGDFQKAARVRAELMSFTWLIVTVAGATILLWNRSFLQLWVGAEYEAGSLPDLLIVLMVIQFVLLRNDANIIDLTLNLRHKVLMGLISVLLSLAIAGVLVGFYKKGIVGLCVAFIAGRAVLSLGYPFWVGRFLGISWYAQVQGALRPFLVTVLLLAAVASLGHAFLVNTWTGLVFSTGMTLVLMTLFAWYTGLAHEQRKNILERVLLTRSALVDR